MGAARRRMRGVYRYRRAVDENAELGRVHQRDPAAGPERIPPAFREYGNANAGTSSRQVALSDNRGDAFARLFEAVHEGIYIGLLGPRDTKTLAANPFLKMM